ncbi:putative PI-specific phospholipase C group protein [Podospora didyma]|uniref:Phosphoinositide phospholipase C n=1 Tax=Podospora didyma TaxID=330526 RepID=A0AAE0P634_9PEZI|nr:putative PI-specific phospholipase C group protein [Podospora didyma]
MTFLERRRSTWKSSALHPHQALFHATLIATVGGNVRSLIPVRRGTSKEPLKAFELSHESMIKHITRIYRDACGTDWKLSRAKFVAFLKETQGLENVDMLEHETYTFQEFFQVWSSIDEAWSAVRKLRKDENPADRPISNYFISSSHNTYLEGNQLSSNSSSLPYRIVLKDGCRCIEIDVWNGSTSRATSRSPIPGHRRHISTASLPRAAVETYESVKQAVSGRSHSRSPSVNSPLNSPPLPTTDSTESRITLDPMEVDKRPVHSRDSSRSNVRRGEPVVHHHGTMTSTVGFREVCQAIAQTAFVKNDLPIIVSLEVGADREQQELMVQIMKEEWAGLLLDKPFDHLHPHDRQPRLDEIKNKILIKVKRVHEAALEAEVERGRSLQISSSLHSKPPICDALAALAIYTHSEHFDHVKSLASRTPSHIFSLSEAHFLTLAGDAMSLRTMIDHNRDFFMRIYPKGLRVDSSNPDPSFHWRRGVQMVAMNWQKTDEGMMVNEAMFANTNGWVLKPTGYLSDGVQSMPLKTMDLRITILAGLYLPMTADRKQSGVGMVGDKKFRPLVKVELLTDKPTKSTDWNRETPPSETQHPTWGKHATALEFLNVTNVVPELSFIK